MNFVRARAWCGMMLTFLATGGLLLGQTLLDFQESPTSSGLFSDADEGEYLITGVAGAVTYIFNSEEGDRITCLVETAVANNSYPRIRLTDGDGASLLEVTGSQSGLVRLENYLITAPGVYQLLVYSNNSASAFSMQALLGKGLVLESEPNQLKASSGAMGAVAIPGGFELRSAGVLEGGNVDYFDLGSLRSATSMTTSVELPGSSALMAGGVRTSLYREGDIAPIASSYGGSLSETIPTNGRYYLAVESPGVNGRYLELDGVSGVNLGNPVSLQISGSQTLEFWLKPNDFSIRRNPLAKAYGGEGTMTIETDGTVNYYYGTNGGNAGTYQTINSLAALRADEWQHLALVRDFSVNPAVVRWYLNGKLTNEVEANHNPAVAGGLDFLIGQGYTNSFQGGIDELRIWNVARNATQIEAGLTSALSGSEAGLVGYYQFEENGGTAVFDASSQGNDGATVGPAAWSGEPSTAIANSRARGIHGTYLLRATIGDAIAPVVTGFEPVPVPGYLFDGTTTAPSNMIGERGNNGSEYLYTVTGSTGGTIWGTHLYRDDSSIAKAAVHEGILQPGETGAVKITVRAGEASYVGVSRNGVSSNSSGSYAGSYEIAAHSGNFTLSGLYRSLWLQFDERMDVGSFTGAFSLIEAGPDGNLGTGDDVTYDLTVGEYTSGDRLFLALTNESFTPGDYRLTVAGSVADVAGNTVGPPHVEEFTIESATEGMGNYVNESGENGSFSSADWLSGNVESGVWSGSLTDQGMTVASWDRPYDVEAADLDGDGKVDGVVSHTGSGDGIRIHPGNGDGTFGTSLDFALGGDTNDALLEDVDGDGDLDVIAAISNLDQIVVLRNDSTVGNLAFTALTPVAAGNGPRRMAAGNLNGDAHLDLAVSNYDGQAVTILLGDGTGGFTASTLGTDLAPRVRAHGVALGLINADAHLDLVVTDYDNGERIAVLAGNGDGTFGAPAFYDFEVSGDPVDVTLVDIDQDGSLDAVVLPNYYYNRGVYVYPGNGDGTLGLPVIHNTGIDQYCDFVESGDWNGDGWPDLLVGGSRYMLLLENRADGSGGFVQRSWAYGDTYGGEMADFTNDGRVDLLIGDYDNDLLRLLEGDARGLLAGDDTTGGVLHGYGRGNKSDGNDNDYFKFSAEAGQVLTVAVDNTGFGAGNRYTRFIIYDSEGSQVSDTYPQQSTNRAGESQPYVIPRDGTYYVRITSGWGDYYDEYRFRVSLFPEGTQVESENNHSIAQADGVGFELNGNELSATTGGYLAVYDTVGDTFNLGNLAEGTLIELDLRLPSTSPLVGTLTLYKSDGTAVTPDFADATNLDYTLPAGAESTYYAKISESSGRGVMAEYFLDIALTDVVPPSITADTLPAEGSVVNYVASDFTLNFSEDMLAATVNDAAAYELLGSGGDGTFDDGNEAVYTVVPGSYGSGLSNSYHLSDGPLQVDSYRFRVATTLKDKLDNSLAAIYERTWSVEGVAGYVTEDRDNGNFQTADWLSENVESGVWSGSLTDQGMTVASWDRPYDVEAADLDGDGKVDGVVSHTGSGDGIRIHPGNGDGTFGTSLDFALGGDTNDALLEDVDGDGDLDVIAAISNLDQIVVLRNDSTVGNLAFTALTPVAAGNGPRRMAAGNLNGDAHLDLAVSNYDGQAVTILLGDGTGGFTASTLGTDLAPRVRAHGVALGLINADAHLDLVVTDYDNGERIAVLAGNGDGTFGAPAFYDFEVSGDPVDVTLVDIDQDGSLDAVVLPNYYYNRGVYVYPGNGDGTLGLPVIHNTGIDQYCDFVESGDWNGDGWPDLLVGGSRYMLLLENRADGSGGFVQRSWAYGDTYGGEMADFTNDGRVDLLIGDYDNDLLRLLEGDARGLLAGDDTTGGVLHGYGRGNKSDGNDNDYFKFSAEAGQVLTVAVDNTGFGAGNRYTRFIIYDSEGSQVSDTYPQQSTNRAGESQPYVIPRDGTYYVRITSGWGDYYDEYRFRVSLFPEGTQVESENNHSIAQADGVGFELNGNELSATTGGYLAVYDTVGDTFNLGNLAEGTLIELDLRLPSTSPLVGTLTLYKSDGTAVTPDFADATNLDYTLPAGAESTYYAKISESSGRGVMAEYFLDIALTDVVPPSITADTLPAEGSVVNYVASDFTLNFSEDMLAATVNDAAAYELLGSGGDGTFDDGNEAVYTVVPGSYGSGLSNSYHLSDGPLQVDSYRFRVATTLKDKLDNSLAAIYERTWSVEGVAGYVTEDRDNGNFQTADWLSENVESGVWSGSLTDQGMTVASWDRPYDVEAADLDGDGKVDGVVSHTGSGDGIRIHPGNGDGTFGTSLDFALGGDTNDALLEDVDGDGDLDVIAAISNLDQIVVLRNDSTVGNLAFTALTPVAAGNGPRRMAAGNLNGDAHLDLAVSNYDGQAVTILLGDGTGGFTASTLGTDLAPRVRAHGVALGLINADAHLDLVVTDYDNGERIAVLAGNGDGTFGAPAFYDFEVSGDPVDVTLVDIDQDGSLDAVVLPNYYYNRGVYVYPGNGDGTLGLPVIHNTGIDQYCDFVESGDWNGDGWPDLLVGGSRYMLLLENRADGSGGFVQRSWAYGDTYGGEMADFTNDGRVDLLIGDYDNDLLRLLEGDARGLLAGDDTTGGVLHGYGRGNKSDGNDNDYFKFSAEAGQVLTVAVDNTGFGAGNRYTRFIIYDSEGSQVSDTYPQQSTNRAGESQPYVIPRDGTYYVRITSGWGDYYDEYRFRVSLFPEGTQVESENNHSIAQADGVGFELNGNELSATTGGYLAVYDTVGDTFNLGNLAEGTLIELDLRLPSTSNLNGILELFDFAGNLKAQGLAGDSGLSLQIGNGEDGTYYARVSEAGVGSLMAEYLLNIAVSDVQPPVIVSTSLPLEPFGGLLDSLTLTFNKDMLASTATDPANYTLVHAGGDDVFSTPDDSVYLLAPGSYSAGLTLGLAISNGPLAPGFYQFKASGLQDTFGNVLPVAYEQSFEITQEGGFMTESEDNGTAGSAEMLIFNDDLTGLLTAAGRGRLDTNSDRDYWSFQAEAGDQLVFEVAYPDAPAGQGLRWYLTSPTGPVIFDRYLSNNDLEANLPVTLTESGIYTFFVGNWYNIRSEYRVRVTLLRGLEYESEDNDNLVEADALTFTTENGIEVADIAGMIAQNIELDYVDLGTVASGNTVFLSIDHPDGSPLVPIVGVYNSSGISQNEVNGTSGDASAEVQISQTGNYYGLVRANNLSAGLMSQYLLKVRVLPTTAVNFPNLQVVELNDIVTPGLESGDLITVDFRVQNVGNLGTGAAAWSDRLVLSSNDVYGDADDIQLALLARTGALAAGGDYTVSHSVNLPHGIAGNYHLFVETDRADDVDEILQEGDNVTRTAASFTVNLKAYPDFVVEDLTITGPDGSNEYDFAWNLANRNNGVAASGVELRLQVVNVTNGVSFIDTILTSTTSLALDETESFSESLQLTDPGYYLVTVTADPNDAVYEFAAGGHALAEQNRKTDNFQIFDFFDVTVTASPVEGGSVSGGGNFREGLSVTVNAVADTSSLPWSFINWTEGGVFVSSQREYTFTASRDRNLVAVFALPQFQITGSVLPSGTGSIAGLGNYALNATASLTAQPAPGYLFDHWSENGSNLGAGNPLQFSVNSARSLRAHFVEANPEHLVSIVTSPAGLTAISGGGTYTNGQILNTTAPASIVQGDLEYLFKKFLLNGQHLNTARLLNKTFSTLDPGNMTYTAVYTQRSLKPVLVSKETNYGTLIPGASDVTFRVVFDRDMNTTIHPGLSLSSASANVIPSVAAGSWSGKRTYVSGVTDFSGDSAGAFNLSVTLATDTNARVMDADASFGFTVDILPPNNPGLALGAMTSSTAAVTWAGYAAPADLAGFRYYLSTSNFATVAGLSPVNGAGAGARQFVFTGLVPDQDYFAGVVAVDSAGNANLSVTPLSFRLDTVMPPAVDLVMERPGIDSALIDWSAYDREIIGLEGFKIYASESPFVSVSGMTPIVDLDVETTEYLFENLDRTMDRHITVVAYNRNGEQVEDVTPVVWSDPLSGSLAEDFNIGGDGAVIPIYESLVLDGGATLKVLPGTTLTFAPGTSLTVSDGALNACGTALAPVHFTSAGEFADPPTAERGDWAGLILEDGDQTSQLQHAWVRFGSGVEVGEGTPAINHLYLVQNATAGLSVRDNGQVNATDCLLTFNERGARVGGNGSLTLGNSVIKSNTEANATQEEAGVLIADSCFWGGPTATGLEGTVSAASPLGNEPVLGEAFAVQGGLTETGSQEVSLFLISANGVGFRMSEDSIFTSTIFEDLFDADDDYRYSPYGFGLPFTLSEGGGLKTIYAQLRSETDVASPTLSTSLTLVTDGPVVDSFNLVDGQTVSRPMMVTATGSAALGVARMEFVVSGVVRAFTTTGSLNFRWDPRSLSSGIARAEIVVRDRAGSVARRALNIILAPAAPPQPVITSPAGGTVTNSSSIALSGTAEPGIRLSLSRNGEVIFPNLSANAAGTFTIADVPLNEGSNSLVVTAIDTLGSSASLPRIVSSDSGPPDAPNLLSAERGAGGTLIEWLSESAETPAYYRLFWNATTFSDPDLASNTSANLTKTIDTFTLGDGDWFVGVAAYDAAGNRSALSNVLQVSVDFTRPTLTVTFDKSMPVGPGILSVQVESSEPLETVPGLTLRSAGSSLPLAVSLTQQTSTLFTGAYQVNSLSSNSGTASIRGSARDLAGNTFVGTPGGQALVFDVSKPTVEVALSSPAPIQTTSSKLLEVSLTLSEVLAPGTTPVLQFEPPVGAIVDIPLSGVGLNWSGSLTVNAAMGSGEGFFRFTGTDAAGNAGTVVSVGEVLELYNSATPDPPGQVTGLTGQILSGGRIRIQWSSAPRAEAYKLYREPGSEGGTPTLLVEGGIADLFYVDLPPSDGLYRYSVVGSLRGADGLPSGVLVAESDRVPPEVAESVSAQLLVRGVEVSFEAPSSGTPPSSYRVYRGASLIRTLAQPGTITDYPPRGSHEYRVATVDQYGNENPSAPITIELLVSPVESLHLHARRGDPYSLTWASNDPTVVGYNVYRDGVIQNGAPLAQAAFVDSLSASGRAVAYEVTAVNAGGDESLRRLVTVYPVGFESVLNPSDLGTEGASYVGYFDKLRLKFENLAGAGMLDLSSVTVNRMVSGEDDLNQTNPLSLSVNPGMTGSGDVVIPAPLTLNSLQSFQVIAEGAVDLGGSRVTYEFNFSKSSALSVGTAANLNTEDIPIAGAATAVQVSLQNFGGADMEIVLGRGGGALPGDLAIVVIDANGEVVSRQAFNGFGASGLIAQSNGDLSVRIASGARFSLTVPGVLIPEYLGPLGEGATLALEIFNLYSGLGTTMPLTQTSVLNGKIFTALIETPYYADLTTDKIGYADDEDVLISGQAINRETGSPEPNAPLRIGFGVRDYVFYQEVTTDASGNYSHTYRPPAGFSGTINLWAAHPDIVDQLNQRTIEYRRFYVVPGSGQIVMSKNDTLEFELHLTNPSDLPIHDIQLSNRAYISNEGVETDIDSINFEILTPGSIDLEPLEVRAISLRVTADLDAPDDALSTLRFISAEGATSKFEAILALRPAVPLLSFTSPAVGYVDMSVNKGEITSSEVVLENKGLRALEGVELIPPQGLAWMDVNLPRNGADRILLPDIPVGGTLRFTVVYAPSEAVSLGLHDDFLLIRGSNLQSDFRVNLFAQLTSSEVGSTKFYVDNIYTDAVPNAKIRLRNPNLRKELGPFYTDSLGEVTVPDLQEGGWSYQISASGHTVATGTFEVIPGQVGYVTQRLSKSLVTVEFTVTPKPFTDRYDITIEQTYETNVPVPVLVMDPPMTQLYDLPDVAEGTIMINIRNEGLASLFQVVVRGQTMSYGSFVPMISYIPELRAQESVEVPFKWTWDIRSLVGERDLGATPSFGGNIEDFLANKEKTDAYADKLSKALSFPSSGNDSLDFCAGTFLNPFPDPKGLAALTQGLACCPDGAPLAAGATSLLVGYSVYSLITGVPTALGGFAACLFGSLFGSFDYGPGGGSNGSSPANSGGSFGPGGGCFIEQTVIPVKDGRFKYIEDIQAGDLVLTGEGEETFAPVQEMISREADNLFTLTLEPLVADGSNDVISLTGTGDHYVWTDRKGWERLDQLESGVCLHHQDGRTFQVIDKKALEGIHKVYTLRVQDDGVFYANNILVQHLCGILDPIGANKIEVDPPGPEITIPDGRESAGCSPCGGDTFPLKHPSMKPFQIKPKQMIKR
ncbi:FG-GAP-like repeat-containing protein [Verrucomicrobiaceae bacterium 227]